MPTEQMKDLVRRLEKAVGPDNGLDIPLAADIRQASTAITSLSADNEALRGALKPFAEIICGADREGLSGATTYIWSTDPEHWTAREHSWGQRITVAMVRQLAAILANNTPQPLTPQPITDEGAGGMMRDWTPSDAADAEDDRRHREWWKRPVFDEHFDEPPPNTPGGKDE